MKTKVKKSAKKVKADKATAAAITKKITDKKDLTYMYPADCDTLEKRKAFRAKTRKKLASLEKNLRLVTKGKGKGDLKTAQKKVDLFKKEFYSGATE